MKDYKKGPIWIFVIVTHLIVAFSFLSNGVSHSVSKEDFYSSLLRTDKNKFESYSKIENIKTTDVLNEEFLGKLLNEKYAKDYTNVYFLVTTSSLSNIASQERERLLSQDRITIVCDSFYEGVYDIVCDKDGIDESSMEAVKISDVSINTNVSVYFHHNSKKNVILLSENSLINPESLRIIRKIIDSEANSMESLESLNNSMDKVSLVNEKFKSIMLLDFTSFFGSIIFLYILLISIDYFINHNNRGVSSSLSKTSLLVLFLFELFVFLLLLLFISFNDTNSINFKYIANYLMSSIYLDGLVLSIREFSVMKITILFMGSIILFTYFVLIFPSFQQRNEYLIKSIKNIKLNTFLMKGILLCLYLILIPVIMYLPIEKNVLVVILVYLLFLIVFYVEQENVDVDIRFGLKERIFVVGIMCALVLFGHILPIDFPEKSVPLVQNSEEIVLIPRGIKISNNHLFEEFELNSTFPILANEFLIYHPHYKEIINKPFNDFQESSVFAVIFGEKDSIIKGIINYDKLLPLVTTSEKTLYFIPRSQEFNSNILTTKLELDCAQAIPPGKISVIFHYQNSRGIFKQKNETIVNFPGCSVDEPTLETSYFANTILDEKVTSDRIVFELKGIFPTMYKSFGIESKRGIEELINIKIEEYSVLFEETSTQDRTLTAYSLDIFEEFPVVYDEITWSEESAVDISRPINQILERGHLRRGFILWSNDLSLKVLKEDLFD